MLLNNLHNVINTPTRVTNTSSTLLDPIAVSEHISVLNSGVSETISHISDHFSTYAFIKSNFVTNSSIKRKVWNYKKADFNQMNALISSTDWRILNEGSIDEAANEFTNIFIRIAERCIPTHFATIRNLDKPWYNSEIRKLSHKRDKLKKKATFSNKPGDWNIRT